MAGAGRTGGGRIAPGRSAGTGPPGLGSKRGYYRRRLGLNHPGHLSPPGGVVSICSTDQPLAVPLQQRLDVDARPLRPRRDRECLAVPGEQLAAVVPVWPGHRWATQNAASPPPGGVMSPLRVPHAATGRSLALNAARNSSSLTGRSRRGLFGRRRRSSVTSDPPRPRTPARRSCGPSHSSRGVGLCGEAAEEAGSAGAARSRPSPRWFDPSRGRPPGRLGLRPSYSSGTTAAARRKRRTW